MGEQAARELYTRLRELKQAAKAARERAGQPSSDREVERQAKSLNSAGARKFAAKRVSEWAHEDPSQAKVPSPASSGQFIALVTIWSAWAGRPFDERSWRTLLDEAQSNRAAAAKDRPSAPTAPPLPPLPQLTRDFTGRDGELKRLLPLLDPDASTADPVLVASVAGMGGIGKTTLALAVAHRALANGWFADALFFDLHGYDENPTTVGQALDSTLRALGVTAERIPTDDDGRAALFRAQLDLRIQQGRGILVVADNASASDQVRHLLPGAGPHRLLITSRHTLADLDAELIDLDVLTPESSVELMATTLRTTKRRPQQITADPEGALRLAKMCGYLPLALELAAAQHVLDPHLTPGGLADDLAEALAETGSRLDQLDDGQRAVVRVSLDRSRRLLKIPEAELLDLLAIAPGTDISTDSAAHLTGQKPREVRRRLTSLAATGLIRQSVGGGRWIMHDLVRDHATEQARITGARNRMALDRLYEYYELCVAAYVAADRSISVNGALRAEFENFAARAFPSGWDSVSWFDAEYSNLIAAVHAAYADGRWLTVARLSSIVSVYLARWRYLDDWYSTSLIGVAAGRASGNRMDESDALGSLGNALRELRRLDEAIEVHRSCVAIRMELGTRAADAWNSLGDSLRARRLFGEAIDAYGRELTLHQLEGGWKGEARARNDMGFTLRLMGRFDEALDSHQMSLAITEKVGDRVGEAQTRGYLGLAYTALGQFDEAVENYRKSLAIKLDILDRVTVGATFNNIGKALRCQGKYEEATEAGRQAVEHFRSPRNPYREAHALGELADTLAAAGHPDDEVRQLRQQASEAYASVGEVDQAAKALTGEDFRD
ncbi:tetratricopeptide repeat protein [Kitasatospora sp. NPDC048239]|uniref:tetratricopeptide repeat protein n=1 Tax=Kitasatospora sp. NPDC048239 TaxID=3364046 RepID=UPI00371A5918